MTHVAVILSGCGFLDGAEIREAVLSLLYLDVHGADVSIFAPDISQRHVVNHLSGKETAEARNVLEESARIARGRVSPLSELRVEACDALVIPGGYGVAKNLSDFAVAGDKAQLLPDFEAVIQSFHRAAKPIGAICIAPAIVASALRGSGARLTVGDDAGVAAAIEGFGCTHVQAASHEAVVDETNRIISCSAYMRDDRLSHIARGIEQVVIGTLKMADGLKMAS